MLCGCYVFRKSAKTASTAHDESAYVNLKNFDLYFAVNVMYSICSLKTRIKTCDLGIHIHKINTNRLFLLTIFEPLILLYSKF